MAGHEMHIITNTRDGRLAVFCEGYGGEDIVIQELTRCASERREIVLLRDDVLPLLHALRSIQASIERTTYEPLRWKTDDDADDGIPF